MNNICKEKLKQVIIEVSCNLNKAEVESNFFDRFYRIYNKNEYLDRMHDVCCSYDIEKEFNIEERINFVDGMFFTDKLLLYIEDIGFGKVLTEQEKKSYVNYQLQLAEESGKIRFLNNEKDLFKKGMDTSFSLYLEHNYSLKK